VVKAKGRNKNAEKRMTKRIRKNATRGNWKRSLVKSISYRLFIMVLDFLVIYLFTRRTDIATGFVILSNIYTTVAYYFHERIWAGIKWGLA
jgi:uncharacterized membrane protein